MTPRWQRLRRMTPCDAASALLHLLVNDSTPENVLCRVVRQDECPSSSQWGDSRVRRTPLEHNDFHFGAPCLTLNAQGSSSSAPESAAPPRRIFWLRSEEHTSE